MACVSMEHVRIAAKQVLEILDAKDFSEFGWRTDEAALYTHLTTLSDGDLDIVHLFLTTLCFGQRNTDTLDTNEDSLFNRVARDLEVDMNALWRADEAFLSKRNKAQLSNIVDATQSKALFGSVENWKKGDLVKKLATHLKRIFDKGAEIPEEEAAQNWIPEAMLFPAMEENK